MQSFFSELDSREPERDPDGIAKAIGRLISDGALDDGDQLPPIRQIAGHLGVSSATVASAWTRLRDHGLITTDRRRGTRVRSTGIRERNRYWQVPNNNGLLSLDLSTGTPDPVLLPRLEPILNRIQADLTVTSYLEPPVLPELEQMLIERWPYPAPALTVLDGANDGLDRVVGQVISLGDVVLVEDPTYPLLLDILDVAGAEIVGIGLDDEGPRVDDLAVGLERQPRAVVLQTGAHNPTGTAISARRATQLATLLQSSDSIVVEDDHVDANPGRPPVSLGTSMPDRVFRIESFSKTYGPDLRIAALSGPRDGIDDIQRRRQMGPGWTSRLLQRILLELLSSDQVGREVEEANAAYDARRVAMSVALDNVGVEVRSGHGLNLWVPVGSEQLATVALASAGIGVSPGQPFRVTDPNPHIRVTTAVLNDRFDEVAAAIAAAADPRIGL